MNIEDILKELASMGNATRRASYVKAGASMPSYGVPLGAIRKMAKAHKKNHELALDLWNDGLLEAKILAIMMFDVERLSHAEALVMLESTPLPLIQDDLVFRCLVHHPHRAELLSELSQRHDDHLQRAYWNFKVDDVKKGRLDDDELDQIMSEIAERLVEMEPLSQWTMNRTLCEIGIKYAARRQACLNLGEALGVYRDMKVSHGCTSAFAPNWIAAVVK